MALREMSRLAGVQLPLRHLNIKDWHSIKLPAQHHYPVNTHGAPKIEDG